MAYLCEDFFSSLEKDGVFHGFVTRNSCAASLAQEHGGSLVQVKQVHGSACVEVSNSSWSEGQEPEGDAMITDVPGLALGIKTADCAPVLFYANTSEGPVIAAAHAGWRGALGGVLEETVKALKKRGAMRSEIRAVIGPTIGKHSYEVSAEFFERFIDISSDYERFFLRTRKKDRLMFDLPGFCAFRLCNSGIFRVFIQDVDTYRHEEDFYSYRRATHRGECDDGRQISMIMIEKS